MGAEVSLGGLVLPVDHVAFATPALDRAREALRAHGLPHTPEAVALWPTPDGPERARTLSAMLADGYLDVIERPAPDEAVAVRALTPTGVVLRCDDLAAARARLVRAGVRCGRPYTIVRRFEGRGPDQRYEIFGTGQAHPCGLGLAVIHTVAASPMANEPGVGSAPGVIEAAAWLGVRLGAA